MSDSDFNSTEYYRSREKTERGLAEYATNPAIAAIHLDMARRYAELISESLLQVAPPRRFG